MKKEVSFILIFVFLILIDISIAGDYGAGPYGRGKYSIGYVAPVSPITITEGDAIRTKLSTAHNFILDKDLIHALVTQGTTQRETLTITNTGSQNLNIEIDPQDLSKFMIISEETFILEEGKSKTVNIDIFAREKEIPEVYTGRIIIKGGTVTKTVNTIIEVKEKRPLFDLKVDVLTKKVVFNEGARAKILVLNLGELKNIDISLYYAIKNFDGTVIHEFKEESIRIDESLEVFRSLKVPENIPLGQYVFYAKLNYEDIIATSSDTFEIVEKKEPINILWLIIPLGFIFIVILILLLVYYLKKWELRLAKEKLKLELEKEKLRQKLRLAEERRKSKIRRERRKRIKNFFSSLGFKSRAERLKEEKEKKRLKQKVELEKRREEKRKRRSILRKRRESEIKRKHAFRKFLRKITLYKSEAERLKEEKEKKRLKQKLIQEKEKKLRLKRRERKKRIKNFLHNVGFYKTDAEKLEEEKLKKKLRLKRDSEKCRLERRRERVKLEKAKEHRLKRRERKKRIKNFLHNVGFYKTDAEKLEEEKEKNSKLKDKKQKIKKLKDKINELNKNIAHCRYNKKKIINYVKELNKQYNKSLMGPKGYYYRLNNVLKNRTLEQWIKYYNKYIDYYKYYLNNYKKELKKLKS